MSSNPENVELPAPTTPAQTGKRIPARAFYTHSGAKLGIGILGVVVAWALVTLSPWLFELAKVYVCKAFLYLANYPNLWTRETLYSIWHYLSRSWLPAVLVLATWGLSNVLSAQSFAKVSRLEASGATPSLDELKALDKEFKRKMTVLQYVDAVSSYGGSTFTTISAAWFVVAFFNGLYQVFGTDVENFDWFYIQEFGYSMAIILVTGYVWVLYREGIDGDTPFQPRDDVALPPEFVQAVRQFGRPCLPASPRHHPGYIFAEGLQFQYLAYMVKLAHHAGHLEQLYPGECHDTKHRMKSLRDEAAKALGPSLKEANHE